MSLQESSQYELQNLLALLKSLHQNARPKLHLVCTLAASGSTHGEDLVFEALDEGLAGGPDEIGGLSGACLHGLGGQGAVDALQGGLADREALVKQLLHLEGRGSSLFTKQGSVGHSKGSMVFKQGSIGH